MKYLRVKKAKNVRGLRNWWLKRILLTKITNSVCLREKEQLRKMNVITSCKHEVYTEEMNKIALSPDDDKRHILEDDAHTLPLGHNKID